MKKLVSTLMLSASLLASPSFAKDRHHWDDHHSGHRHHHGHHDNRSSSRDAAIIVGGVLLGAALANAADNRSYSRTTTTYYSSEPSYRSDSYRSDSYRSDRYYSRSRTEYYGAPVVIQERRVYEPVHYYNYEPRERRYEHRAYSRPRDLPRHRLTEDEWGNCYKVNYYNGRRILKEIPRHHCDRY